MYCFASLPPIPSSRDSPKGLIPYRIPKLITLALRRSSGVSAGGGPPKTAQAGEAPRGGVRLVERRVDATGPRVHHPGKDVDVRGPDLREGPVFEEESGDLVSPFEPFQHLHVRRGAALAR